MIAKLLQRSTALITQIKGTPEYLKQSKDNKTYILNFSADWCGPCKAMAPIMAKKQEESKGKWKLFKVNIDLQENAGLNEQFGIQAVPTMIFFKDGKQIHRTVGGLSPPNLEAAIKKLND